MSFATLRRPVKKIRGFLNEAIYIKAIENKFLCAGCCANAELRSVNTAKTKNAQRYKIPSDIVTEFY